MQRNHQLISKIYTLADRKTDKGHYVRCFLSSISYPVFEYPQKGALINQETGYIIPRIPSRSGEFHHFCCQFWALTQVDSVGELLLSLNKQQFRIYRSRSQDLILAADLNVARVSAWLDRKLRAKMHVSRIRCSCSLSSTKVRQQDQVAGEPTFLSGLCLFLIIYEVATLPSTANIKLCQ